MIHTGADITSVTLNGVAAKEILSQTQDSVVVRAGRASSEDMGTGNIVVSTNAGTLVVYVCMYVCIKPTPSMPYAIYHTHLLNPYSYPLIYTHLLNPYSYTHTPSHTHTHIYTHTHIHTHTYTQAWCLPWRGPSATRATLSPSL
jgi:hypothetical protein